MSRLYVAGTGLCSTDVLSYVTGTGQWSTNVLLYVIGACQRSSVLFYVTDSD